MNNYYRTLIASESTSPVGPEALSWTFDGNGDNETTATSVSIFRRRSGVVTTLVSDGGSNVNDINVIPIGSGPGELQTGDEIRIQVNAVSFVFPGGALSVDGILSRISRVSPYMSEILWSDSEASSPDSNLSIFGPGPTSTTWITINTTSYKYEVNASAYVN